MTDTVTVIVTIVVLCAVFGAGVMVQRFIGTLNSLSERIEKLEGEKQNRNPYKTNDGIEDSTAISLDLIFKTETWLDYIQQRAKKQLDILQVIRSDPDQYDSDQPNGKREL